MCTICCSLNVLFPSEKGTKCWSFTIENASQMSFTRGNTQCFVIKMCSNHLSVQYQLVVGMYIKVQVIEKHCFLLADCYSRQNNSVLLMFLNFVDLVAIFQFMHDMIAVLLAAAKCPIFASVPCSRVTSSQLVIISLVLLFIIDSDVLQWKSVNAIESVQKFHPQC